MKTRLAIMALVTLLASCGAKVKDCEEYCRYSTDVGACVDRCRNGKDGGELCDLDEDCSEPEGP